MKKKPVILIFGANGMLGFSVSGYFEKKGYPVIALVRNEFDILNEPLTKLQKLIKSSDVVINCAGVIKPQIAKNKVGDVLKINGVFPWNLARICLNANKKCFHIATDCVFSGKKGNYNESDLVDAEDLYGLSKSLGDTNLCMTLRTSIIGEEQGQARSLVEWIKSNRGKEIQGFTNHKWNGVTTVYLAEIIETIVSRSLYKPGVYHIFSPQTVSKYQLLKIISQAYGLNCKVVKSKAAEKIDRSLTSLNPLSSKLLKKPLKQQIMEMRDFFEKVK